MGILIDLYELSPMQQGMLFHSLYESGLDSERYSGLYIEQRTCQLWGQLNVEAFKQAWQCVVDRHPILRTGFYWEEMDKPLQAVFDHVELPWTEQDWQPLNTTEQAASLEEFLQSDRTQEFALDQAPLMRCALFQLDAETYQFVWTHHHLLMDGWCNAILLQEVIQFYEAVCHHRSITLAPPPAYRDYISWLQQQDQTQAQQFWQQNLQGFITPTALPLSSLPLSSPRSEIRLIQEQQLYLSEMTTTQLQAFCQQHRFTLSTLIQAAWALLLSYYSQEPDVLFGVTVSGRPPALPGIESTIGLFINTVPVRVQLPDNAELLPWLQQLQAQQLEREQYAYSSLIDIQSWSQVPRGVPLFDSLVVVENYPISIETALQGQHSLHISQSRGFAQTHYPLTLSAIPGRALLLQISFNQQFTSDSIIRLLEQLQTILQSIISQPQQLSQISLLTAAEQEHIAAWNHTDRHFPLLAVSQQFELQVEQTPDAIALISQDEFSQDECLSYQALNARANQLAHYLCHQGVGSGTLVAVRLDRSAALIISLLAILKTGAAYLPLDPAYPPDRLAFMQVDAQVSFILTQDEFNTAFNTQHPHHNLGLEIPLESLAYVIYTSGSTGQPKGVLVPHRALSNYACAAAGKFELTAGDRVLQFASISFDAAAEEIYPTLLTGATLVLRSKEMIRTAATFLQMCQHQQLTVLDLPTAYWHQLVQHTIAESLSIPATLRLLIIGGEAANPDLVRAWQQYAQSQIRLINTYGPTETTIVATWWEAIESTEVESTGIIPIGKPIPNVQVYVLDRYFKLVPVGVPGELYIGGLGIAKGYLNQPQLTAEQFIPNPFLDPSPNSFLPFLLSPFPLSPTLYKTGDRVRYLPDGNLEFLGRLDQQTKLRGFRIELGEIEATLKKHPTIQDAAVLLQEDPSNPQLIAYLTPSPHPPIPPSSSRVVKELANRSMQTISLLSMPMRVGCFWKI